MNADICITRLHDAFLTAGWTVEELDKDYGEDLQVRIFDDGEATPYLFFVQAKHLDRSTRRRSGNEQYASYRFQRHHLRTWQGFSEPVVLALWDVQADRIYWEVAQSIAMPATETHHCTVRFPTDNLLDADGLARIRSRTVTRFKRLDAEQHGAQILVDRLRELYDIKIDYDPHGGRLGIELPNGDTDITFFGRTAEQLEQLRTISAKQLGCPPEDVQLGDVYLALIQTLVRMADDMEKGHPAPIPKNGSLEWTTSLGEFLRHWHREAELELWRSPVLPPESDGQP